MITSRLWSRSVGAVEIIIMVVVSWLGQFTNRTFGQWLLGSYIAIEAVDGSWMESRQRAASNPSAHEVVHRMALPPPAKQVSSLNRNLTHSSHSVMPKLNTSEALVTFFSSWVSGAMWDNVPWGRGEESRRKRVGGWE